MEDNQPIDYDFLKKLVNIEGLSNVLQPRSTKEAHTAVMSSYRRVFVQPPQAPKLPPTHTEQRLSEKSSLVTTVGDRQPGDQKLLRSCQLQLLQRQTDGVGQECEQHDVRVFTRRAHGEKVDTHRLTKHVRIQQLRQLLAKPQYERNSDENLQIFRLMRSFDGIRTRIPDNLLRHVATVAKLERWPEGDVTLLGHGSLFMVLSGCVVALTDPVIREEHESEEEFLLRCSQVDPDEQTVLRVSDMFGTLRYTNQPTQRNSKILAFYLPDDNTEFLKITAYDYDRIREQTESRDEVEKSNLLKENPNYALWSAQPLLRVARLLDWVRVPANTVIVSEGFKSPFIAYVKSGTCLLLRKITVNKTLKNGQEVRQTVHIVMDRVGCRQSFGEASILDNEDMPCSLVAEDDVTLAVLRPEQLEELDEDTRMLVGQSADEKLGRMPQEEVEKEYVVQESAKEWNETKQTVIADVINTRGIRPGLGKWAK